jgi:hypothetical protein
MLGMLRDKREQVLQIAARYGVSVCAGVWVSSAR